MPQRRTPSGQGPGSRGRPARGTARSGRDSTRTGTLRVAAAGRGTRVAGATARPASRSAPPRRAAAAGTVRMTAAAPPRRVSGRAAVLGLVLVAMLLTYAYPIRTYLSQQAQIAHLVADQAAQRQRIVTLTEQSAKWDDPAYVRSQARRRLQMVRPGEVAYVIVDGPADAPGDAPASAPDAGRANPSGPWYAQMWSSVRAADHPRVR